MPQHLLLLLACCGAPLASVVDAIDWRNHSGHNFVTHVKSSTNPPGCDASWAFAAASMLGDRLTIARYRGEAFAFPTKVSMSAQYFVNCAMPETEEEEGCEDGGDLAWALARAAEAGVVDETCASYRASKQPCDALNVCVNCFGACEAVADYLVYNVSDYGRVDLSGSDHARLRAQVDRGPVACKVRADASLPSRDRPFHASVVGYTSSHVIANPNFGTYRGNASASKPDGFFLLPFESLLECWHASPHLQGIGTVTHYDYAVSRDDGEEEEKKKKKKKIVVPRSVARSALEAPASSAPPPAAYSALAAGLRRLGASAPPASFDWRSVVPLTPMRSHHVGPVYCGACYSMATTSTFSDRLKIARSLAASGASGSARAAEDTLVAAQSVIDCVSPFRGCLGGNAQDVYAYMEQHALPDESCNPFQSAWLHGCARHECLDCPTDATSPFECSAVLEHDTYKSRAHGLVKGETEMMQELLAGGPIECMLLDSIPSFADYKGDGLICEPSNATGHNHDVELVGWGETDTGQQYWIGRNSWGSQWGDQGWFRLCKGTNNLGIEQSGCAFVAPDLEQV